MTTDPRDAEIARLTAALNEADACNRGLVRLNEALQQRAEKAEADRDKWFEGAGAHHVASMREAQRADQNAARAEKAEAALSESQAREAMLHRAITEASEPDFIWGAMDNVNDMDADLDEFAKAASRAIRAAVPTPAAALLPAGEGE